MTTRVLGIDLAIQAPNVAVAVDEKGALIGEPIRFELSIEELERVEETALRGVAEGTKLHVVMEKTYPASQYASAFFRDRGHETSFAKPDQVKAFRKCLSPKVKTDARDAYVMARLPALDPKQLERIHVAPPALQALKMLVSQRVSMVRQLVTLKNQFIAYANAVWPGVNRVFGDLDSAHARSFLREQTPKTLQELEMPDMVGFLKERGQIQASYAERLACRLLNLGQRALGLHQLLPEEEIELDRRYTIELLGRIETLEQEMVSKEAQVEEAYLRCDPEQHLRSIPGIAEKTAPTILAYFGETDRFATVKKAQGFVGLFPATDSSGDMDRKGTSITKQGPALLRRDLFLAADHFRRLDPQGAWMYYDRMVNKGKHHNSALCVIANRMLIPRILAVVRQGRPYQLCDFDGSPIDKQQARQLVATCKVPQAVRRRLRNKKAPLMQESREGQIPQVTSELEAPRNGKPSRPLDSIPKEMTVTRDQYGMLLFRTMERLLNTGANVEEIRFHLREEATNFFRKRS